MYQIDHTGVIEQLKKAIKKKGGRQYVRDLIKLNVPQSNTYAYLTYSELKDGMVSMAALARSLGMASRTLQSHLIKEGTTIQQLRGIVRLERVLWSVLDNNDLDLLQDLGYRTIAGARRGLESLVRPVLVALEGGSWKESSPQTVVRLERKRVKPYRHYRLFSKKGLEVRVKSVRLNAYRLIATVELVREGLAEPKYLVESLIKVDSRSLYEI